MCVVLGCVCVRVLGPTGWPHGACAAAAPPQARSPPTPAPNPTPPCAPPCAAPQVRMNEGSMPPMVMAIAPPATARTMLLDSEDVKARGRGGGS